MISGVVEIRKPDIAEGEASQIPVRGIRTIYGTYKPSLAGLEGVGD